MAETQGLGKRREKENKMEGKKKSEAREGTTFYINLESWTDYLKK